jgi:hypothetical protein
MSRGTIGEAVASAQRASESALSNPLPRPGFHPDIKAGTHLACS